MSKKLGLLVVSAQLCMLASANAASDKPSGSGVTTFGTTRPLDVVRGSGTDVPLSSALAAIVPRDFTIRTTGVSPTVLSQPVSWSGGRGWTDVLLDMLEPYPELVVDVSLGARLVIVRQVSLPTASDSSRDAMIPPMQQAMPNNARAASYMAPQPQPASRPAREPATAAMPYAPSAPSAPAAMTSAQVAAATPGAIPSSTQAAIQAATQAAIQTATQAAIQSAIQAATQAATQAAAEAARAAEQESHRATTWEIRAADRTIKGALSRWAAAAGWQMSWELSVDYPVYAQASFPGQFEAAVETVVKSLENTEVPVRAVFYRGNRVLRFIAKGVQ